MGTGHLLRCLALAQGLKDGGNEVIFLTHCEPGKLIERVKGEGFKVYPLRESGDTEETGEILRDENPGWLVLDGYQFDAGYQKAVKEAGYRLLVIDDYAHLPQYHADIVLNQNFGAERYNYRAEPYTKLLLGTKYVLLRREFLKYKNFKRIIPKVAKKVLVTLGGADPGNNTLDVLRAANGIDATLDVKVVIGAGNPHYTSIKDEAEGSRHDIEILRDVGDMAPLMAWADVAVSAGGTTVWEVAFMGLPALLCIVAENQEGAVNAMADEGYVTAGWINESSAAELGNLLEQLLYGKELREAIKEKGRQIVDGNGAKRVIEEMKY